MNFACGSGNIFFVKPKLPRCIFPVFFNVLYLIPLLPYDVITLSLIALQLVTSYCVGWELT